MDTYPISLDAGSSEGGLAPIPQANNENRNARHFNCTIEDDRARTTNFVSKKLVWIDDFGISLND